MSQITKLSPQTIVLKSQMIPLEIEEMREVCVPVPVVTPEDVND